MDMHPSHSTTKQTLLEKTKSNKSVTTCDPKWSRIKTRFILPNHKCKGLDIPTCHVKHSHIMASKCQYARVHLPIPLVIGEVDAITSARDSACTKEPGEVDAITSSRDSTCRKVPGEGVAVTNKKSTTFQVCHFLPS